MLCYVMHYFSKCVFHCKPLIGTGTFGLGERGGGGGGSDLIARTALYNARKHDCFSNALKWQYEKLSQLS